MPRSYRSDKRRAAAECTRDRIVAAARRLLRSRRELGELTIDAVAAEAKVARMSVYNAVKSKSGLLEAILDDISASGLPQILSPSQGAMEALDSYLAAFAHFWEAERFSIRRLRALAVLDRDVRAAIARREKRRWTATLELAARFAEERGKPLSQECVDIFYIAASFESYDCLRIIGRNANGAAREVRLLCHRIVDPVG